MVDLGFMPQPVPLGTVLGMRINEMALHGWDVEVALDPGAQLSEEAAGLVVEHFASTMAFLLGFTGQARAGADPARDRRTTRSSSTTRASGSPRASPTRARRSTVRSSRRSGCSPAGSRPSTRPRASR